MAGRDIKNGIDRYGFTFGVDLEWSTIFLGICGLGFSVVIFFVGLAYGVGVLCE